jgi:hypothetical protein
LTTLPAGQPQFDHFEWNLRKAENRDSKPSGKRIGNVTSPPLPADALEALLHLF